MSDLGVCAVLAGTERRARHEIERAGFGTRMPAYRVSFYRRGKRHVLLRPLFPGYVFPVLQPGWGEITAIDGVHVLIRAGEPVRIVGKDDHKFADLEHRCLLGEFNRVQLRDAAGKFKKRKRRRRPRPGKLLRQNPNCGANHSGGNYGP